VGAWNIVLLTTAGLLATIALLQYRWIRQISAAMELRVRCNLESLMTQWNPGLYGDLSAICVVLQVGPDSGARDVWSDYVHRYVARKQHQPVDGSESIRSNPALISAIYLWQTNGRHARPKLLLMNPDSDQIEERPAPPEIAVLLDRLEKRSQALPQALRAWELPNPTNTELNLPSASPANPQELW
jgi:hypothetical protein